MMYSYNNNKKINNEVSKSASYFLIVSLILTGMFVVAPAVIGSIDNSQETISPALQSFVAESRAETVKVLISTETNEYTNIVDKVYELGGTVSIQFKYARGLAAEIPRGAIAAISQIGNVIKVALDEDKTPTEISREQMTQMDLELTSSAFGLDSSEITALDLSAVEVEALASSMAPNNYGSPASMEALSLWAEGNFGQGNLAVVIDTGIYKDHSMFGTGQVIGGIDISTDAGTVWEDPFSVDNHYHGTHVAGSIAGQGAYLFPTASLLVQSMLNHGFDVPEYDADPSLSVITLFGMAPLTDLYAIKVFNHLGGSASNSIIISGIEHAMDLHQSGTDVDVINMSLGGGNGFDGRDLETQVVDAATALGITMVISAGNEGPASQTIGSPGVANTALTAGAALTPEHTRVFWDFNFGFVGAGDLLFTPDETQMIYFSSRGPTSDGRDKPTASTVGVFVLSSMTGGPTELGFLSGTSMAAPNMAGIVSLLNTVGEGMGATPYDYKQAIIAGSTPLSGYEEFEQGAGFVSAADSMAALLADENLGEAHPGLSNGYSATSVNPAGTHFQTKSFTFDIQDLTPGHVVNYWFSGHPNMEKITVDFSNVDLGVDPILFNSFEFHLMSPMRTSDSGYYFATTNVYGDATFEVSDLSSTVSGDVYGVFASDLPLMNGNYRLAIENDWTSFDDLSGTVTITIETGNNSDKADETFKGKLANYDWSGWIHLDSFGANGVEIKLSWFNDWSRYPTSDLDMIIAWFDTDGGLHWEFGGATLNSPEMVRINADNIAHVQFYVDGFETYGQIEAWEVDVTYL